MPHPLSDAIDALTTQARRIADALQTAVDQGQTAYVLAPPPADDGPTTPDPAVKVIAHHLPMSDQRAAEMAESTNFLTQWIDTTPAADDAPRRCPFRQEIGPHHDVYQCTFRAGHPPEHGHSFNHKDRGAPADEEQLHADPNTTRRRAGLPPHPDDEEQLRTARRASLHNLLVRATRGALTTDECAMLWKHVEAEQQEADLARSVARSAAKDAADALKRADQAEELLGIAHETSNKSEAARAEAQRDRDQHAAVLRDVLDQFTDWPKGGTLWPEGGVVARVDADTWDRWDAVAAPTAEEPWWVTVAEVRTEWERARATNERVRAIIRRLTAHAVGFQDVLDDTDHGPWGRTVGSVIAELAAALDNTDQPTTEA